jgi:hypothetical protein
MSEVFKPRSIFLLKNRMRTKLALRKTLMALPLHLCDSTLVSRDNVPPGVVIFGLDFDEANRE